jgi:hypothetical protein
MARAMACRCWSGRCSPCCWRRAASLLCGLPGRGWGRVFLGRNRLAAGRRGGHFDAAQPAAAGAGGPLAAARALLPPRRRWSRDAEPQDAPVIIAGFGRYGQIVGRLIWPRASGHRAGPRRRDGRGRAHLWLPGVSTATPPGWTCCAWPARSTPACWWWRWTTWSSPGHRGPGARALPAPATGGPRARRDPLEPAARPGRSACGARAVRVQPAQRALGA